MILLLLGGETLHDFLPPLSKILQRKLACKVQINVCKGPHFQLPYILNDLINGVINNRQAIHAM